MPDGAFGIVSEYEKASVEPLPTNENVSEWLAPVVSTYSTLTV
jgi:hypothetical protein